jgi:hypothetical protein
MCLSQMRSPTEWVHGDCRTLRHPDREMRGGPGPVRDDVVYAGYEQRTPAATRGLKARWWERPSAPRRGHLVDPEIRRRCYDADRPAWPAPIITASYTCTVVQQRTGTGYAAPGPAGSAATALSG